MTIGAAYQQVRGNNPQYQVRLFWNSNDFASESSNTYYFYVTTQNVPQNTTLYWEFIGATTTGYTSPASSADFAVSSGSFSHNFNYAGNSVLQSNLIDGDTTYVTFQVLMDSLTEGGEAFQINIRTGSAAGPIVATSNVIKIIDFSTTPAPTYAVAAAGGVTSVNEGSSLTFNVTTTNVSNGTTLYWTVSNAVDFATSSGSFTINTNAGSFSVTPTADTTTEGAETFIASIRTGSTAGTIVANSASITINDTSVTPPTITTRSDANAANLRLAIPFSTTSTTDDVAYLVSGSPNTAKLTPIEAAGGSIVTNTFKFYNSSYQPATSGIGYTLPVAINTSSTFLIEFWARTTSTNTNNWIFSNDYNSAREWTIGLNTGGSMPTTLTPNVGNGRIGGVPSGTWNHFAFSEAYWWYNGTRRGTCNWGGTGYTTFNVWVGRQKDYTIFDGQINDFRIYIGTNKYGTATTITVPSSILL